MNEDGVPGAHVSDATASENNVNICFWSFCRLVWKWSKFVKLVLMQSKVFDLILILWHLEAIYENKACTTADTIRLGNEGKVKIFIHSDET